MVMILINPVIHFLSPLFVVV